MVQHSKSYGLIGVSIKREILGRFSNCKRLMLHDASVKEDVRRTREGVRLGLFTDFEMNSVALGLGVQITVHRFIVG